MNTKTVALVVSVYILSLGFPAASPTFLLMNRDFALVLEV